MSCRHTFASSQDSQIGLQQGRTQHLDQALHKTSLYVSQQNSHMEASKRAGTAYLNMRSNSHEFDLTHKTGSFMYMAPEVFKERKYNEKVGRQHCGTFWAVSQLLMLALGVRLLSWFICLAEWTVPQSRICTKHVCLCLNLHKYRL